MYFASKSAPDGRASVVTTVEPRDFWDRNTVLAEAFCTSDERVRQAQSVLDEAQAERSRTLAAFAVTVGRDGTIADLMGLNEREVRMARRTVGRGSARTIAERLLAHAPQPGAAVREPPPTAHTPAPPAQAAPAPPAPVQAAPPPAAPAPAPLPPPVVQEAQAPPPREEPPAAPRPAPVPLYVPPGTPQEPTASTTGRGPEPEHSQNAVIWSASMDSVLLWSWKSGLDLQTVAAELGLDVRTLLLRVQVLADEGLLTPQPTPPPDFAPPPPPPATRRSGRHRRHHEEAYAAFFSPTMTTFPTYIQR